MFDITIFDKMFGSLISFSKTENHHYGGVSNMAKNQEKDRNYLEAENLAQRFKNIHSLMNQGKVKFTLPKMAEILGLEKAGDLEQYFCGKVEASFAFKKHFCSTFGVNYDYLNEGKSNPFYISDSRYNPMEHLDDIVRLKPKIIYFVQEKTSRAESFVALKLQDYHYKIYTKTYPISGYVGATGRGQIYEFYKLIKTLLNYRFNLMGIRLDTEKFWKIQNGEVFAGSILEDVPNSYWWDDLLDIDHRCQIAENYEEWYGKDFLVAQEIIKSFGHKGLNIEQ